MVSTPDKYARRRARSSAVSTIIGISLVLFMLGILGVLILNAQKLAKHVRENLQIQVFLADDLNEAGTLQLRKEIDAEPYTLKTEYISKEEAAEDLQREIGEDFMAFLGTNPLQAAIDLHVKAEYAVPDSLMHIASALEAHEGVAEVVYSPNLVRQINENVNKIGLVLLGFSALLLLVAIALINNTIRLTIYSKRFIIRSMQLVGATAGFIQRPFVWQGILQGVYAGLIAILLIMGVLYVVRNRIPEFFEINDLPMFIQLFAIVAVLGITIAGLSTLLAVRRYLRKDARKIF